MRTGLAFAAFAASLFALSLSGGVAAKGTAVTPPVSFSLSLLAEHNLARDDAGVPRLKWSDRLAQDAQGWANRLAREGDLRHASDGDTDGAGENLWMGTAGYFGPESMVDTFVEEKRYYVHGTFPGVSRTGRWEDVGHYTQVIWRETREVGCAIARNARDDFLVCRYWPAGNWMGEAAY